jgi:hypothetical protein
MPRPLALFDHWCALASDVEWLCHVALGYFFAPWHPPTAREYAEHRDLLRARVDAMLADGALLPARGLVMRAAIAAHGAPYSRNATLDDLHRRDTALRAAFEPPALLRARVRAAIPIAPWPPPSFIPPPATPHWLPR